MNDCEARRDWLQLVAATDYVAELERPGFTVADAIEEALRRWLQRYLEPIASSAELVESPWNDPDPLRTTLLRLMDAVPSAGSYDGVVLGDVLTAAVRAWVGDMADEVNEGREFATVSDVAGFPSPTL
jgi:hypothetical protein